MVQLRTMVNVADNTGPKIIQCIGVLGGYRKRYARIGEIFNAVVKKADPHGVIKKGEIVMAVLVRSTKEIKRKDGTYVRFDDNAAVIIDKESREPKGTRIFGPVARELRENYIKIISLAPEVL
ncbi:MAG: 50S ribosomal protein L14 [Patescibacteria group bacterium]